MSEPSLEQRILEAAEEVVPYKTVLISGMRGQYTIDIRESLKAEQAASDVDGVDGHSVTGPLRDYLKLTNPANIKALLEEKNRERDEWKRIASGYRNGLLHADCHKGETCSCCKSYDALTGKGEPK